MRSATKPESTKTKLVAATGVLTSWTHVVDTRFGSHNKAYVNPFVRGRRPPWWLRFSSTVGGQRLVTRIVGNPAPVASEFDWIPSPFSDGFRFGG